MQLKTGKLCRRAVLGDRQAAEKLLGSTYKAIFGYLYRLCGDSTDAEDLTQDTYARVWAALPGFEQRCSFMTWLHRIAYHVYVDWCRRRKLPLAGPGDWWQECVDRGQGPAENAADKQLAGHIYTLVEQLPEEQRQLIHLHYYQGLSLRDTAYVMDAPLSSIKYRMRKALDYLKQKLEIETYNR